MARLDYRAATKEVMRVFPDRVLGAMLDEINMLRTLLAQSTVTMDDLAERAKKKR